jgi:hypothetical protein
MTGQIQVLDYGAEPIAAYTVKFNCLWLSGAVERKPQNDNWLDARHQKVADALHALDAAVLELCIAEGRKDI